MTHPLKRQSGAEKVTRGSWVRTVNSNGKGFRQGEAIGTDESWDLAQWVDLQILRISRTRVCLNELDVEIIGFGDDKARSGARVPLGKM